MPKPRPRSSRRSASLGLRLPLTDGSSIHHINVGIIFLFSSSASSWTSSHVIPITGVAMQFEIIDDFIGVPAIKLNECQRGRPGLFFLLVQKCIEAADRIIANRLYGACPIKND